MRRIHSPHQRPGFTEKLTKSKAKMKVKFLGEGQGRRKSVDQ